MPARRRAGRSRAATSRAATSRDRSSRAATSRDPSSRATASNHHGIHLLRSSGTVRALIESADLVPDALVLDLGAGPGTLTAPLARTGARVIAIERDPAFLLRLRERFDGLPNVRVVAGDLTVVPLPRGPFQVVASIPYALSTTLLRRLLPGRTRLSAADLVVEWGFARRISAPVGRDLETAWWAARFDLRLVRRIPAASFRPLPAVDSAHLRIRARPGLGERRTQRILYALLTVAYRSPDRPARAVLAEAVGKAGAHRIAASTDLDQATVAGDVAASRWGEVSRLAAAGPAVVPPHLPRIPARLLDPGPGGPRRA
ncbi:rRNA adenine N(6)-methyltransferase family protein [Actinopolymorpha pittospori]